MGTSDPIAADARSYRNMIRPRLVSSPAHRHIIGTPAEHPLMHDWFVKRGLKVRPGAQPWYDDATHTLYHPEPENKSAVVKAYLGVMRDKVQLARNEFQQPGAGQAARTIDSSNHRARVAVVKQVLAEAGLTKARVEAVLAQSDKKGTRPAVMSTIASAPPRVARFAAAWAGLLTGSPHMTVFHPGEGEDLMHVIDSPHDPAHVGTYLSRAGVPQFVVHKQGTGSRAYVVNPMGLIDVPTAANGVQGQTQSIRGTAVRIGGATDKDARASYRSVIDDAEKEAGGAEQATQLAAIQPANRPGGSVLVRVPTPEAVPAQKAAPAPAPHGPTMILPI